MMIALSLAVATASALGSSGGAAAAPPAEARLAAAPAGAIPVVRERSATIDGHFVLGNRVVCGRDRL